ncbi:MAG TPA: flagellar basal body rod protein FlgC [Vicinamibacterales bacterium]|nr:flagellar basal body rod protein FlgC [Vicinamibacterales bacterium]
MSSLSSALAASASALKAELVRVEVATSNLANADSTRGPDGGPYRRRDVILGSAPINTFESELGGMRATGVEVQEIVEDTAAFKRRYEPSHPDADAEGYVGFPNVNTAEEMVDLLSAARAYQANLAAVGVVRDLLQSSLELGR